MPNRPRSERSDHRSGRSVVRGVGHAGRRISRGAGGSRVADFSNCRRDRSPGETQNPEQSIAMTDHEFEFICSFLQERSAIVLEPGKEYLVETRLAPIVKHFNLDSIGGLVQRLRDRLAIDVHTRVVEAMVTTETLFFRDHHPFETLRKTVLPELIAKRRTVHALNIWCAACSTGQEPYSLAILIREHFPELLSWKVTFLASD